VVHIAVHGNRSQSYGATGCHLYVGLYSVTCYLTQVNAPRLNPIISAWEVT